MTVLAISQAPLQTLQEYQTRMGWTFKWASALANDFSRDYHVSFTPKELDEDKEYYIYQRCKASSEEMPGASVFFKDYDEAIFHIYSTYSRGLNTLSEAYHFLDLVPKDCDEESLAWPMEWIRHHDKYENNQDQKTCWH